MREYNTEYLERFLDEIDGAIRSQQEKENIFTLSVLQDCYNMVTQLKRYKSLEEQGKLLKLPCAVGDTVYVANKLCTGKKCVTEEIADIGLMTAFMLNGEFEKTVFLTKEEAEVTLKEL